MHSNYWLLLVFIVPLFFYCRSLYKYLSVNSGKIWRYLLVVTYKLFTPWKHDVTFILFYAADVFTSIGGLFKDIVDIIGCNLVPDYI